MKRIRLSVLLTLAWSSLTSAQQISGSGISGAGGSSTSWDYVRVHWGPDTTQLVAAVFFRGSSNWGAVTAQESQWAVRASDSASRAAESRGHRSGGTITPRARAWVEYDDEGSEVIVLDRKWRLPRRDSALVILVDRIDGVGGSRMISTVMVPVSPLSDPHGDVDAWYSHWDRALRANTTVRDYMDDPYLTLHLAYADSAAGRRRVQHGDSTIFIAAEPVLSDYDFATVAANAGPRNTITLQATCRPDACKRLASATSRNVGAHLAALVDSRVRNVSRIASAIGTRPMFTLVIDADSTEAGQILQDLQARWPRDRKPPP